MLLKFAISIACLTAVIPKAVIGGPILITYTEANLGGGVFQYDYTVTNNLDPITQAGVDLFDIVFTFPVAPSIVSVPFGWASIPNVGSIQTFSTNVGEPPLGTDIPPGGSLAGFSFQFGQQLLAPVPFTATFSDFTVLDGTTIDATVPEPTSAVMVGTSIVLIGLLTRKRYRSRLSK